MSGSSIPTGVRCFSGGRCSLIWTVVGILFMVHLISVYTHRSSSSTSNRIPSQPQISLNSTIHELQRVNHGTIRIPKLKKRPQRATKRRPRRRYSSPIIEEFLDPDSPIRHIFFPDAKTAVDPRKEAREDEDDGGHIFPGRIWLDTDGKPIQAHGGGMLYDEKSKIYYWYGEYKDGPTYRAHNKGPARIDVIGVGCYSSKDLWEWKNEGIVLAAEKTNETHDLHTSNVLERPKVIYNGKTQKYVMWMHIDNANYTKASTGVAISDRPTGPFEYLYSITPHGFDSRDMTVFKDDDDEAYLFYSSESNGVLHIGPLTADYLDVKPVTVARVMVGQRREAPAVFKHDGVYYMITSGCSGWAPNEAMAHAAAGSIMGPWETLGNPCVAGDERFRTATFFAQGTFVVPIPSVRGLFVFMADRWNPADLRDSRYVWLPLVVGGAADRPLESSFAFPVWPRVSIYWHQKWRLPLGWSVS